MHIGACLVIKNIAIDLIVCNNIIKICSCFAGPISVLHYYPHFSIARLTKSHKLFLRLLLINQIKELCQKG